MNFDEFIGQEHCKSNLLLLIDATKNGRKLPHIGLFGPAGTGKTTLAEIIAEKIGASTVYINGSAITSPTVFRKPIAQAVAKNGRLQHYIIIVDECHSMSSKIQNNLLSVLEEPAILCTPVEKKIKLPNGKHLHKGDILKEKLPENVSFIFATTDKGKLIDPLVSRLHSVDLDEYSLQEKETVVKNNLVKNNVTLEDEDYEFVANITKSMRHLVKICDRIVDYAVGQNINVLSHNNILHIIEVLGIDKFGCDKTDQKYLQYVKEHAPVSLSNIARFLNVQEKEVKEKIEPFLIRKEWVNITSKGRIISEVGKEQVFGETSLADNDSDNLMEILEDVES